MRRRIALTLLLSACWLAPAGCGRSESGGIGARSGGVGHVSGGGGAESAIPALNSFTEELLAKVDAARDRKAGVAEAQALLDGRRAEMSALIAAAKRGAQGDPEAKRRWLEAEVDNTDRVHRLQLKYSDEAARDPELKARLNHLVAGYDSMFDDR